MSSSSSATSSSTTNENQQSKKKKTSATTKPTTTTTTTTKNKKEEKDYTTSSTQAATTATTTAVNGNRITTVLAEPERQRYVEVVKTLADRMAHHSSEKFRADLAYHDAKALTNLIERFAKKNAVKPTDIKHITPAKGVVRIYPSSSASSTTSTTPAAAATTTAFSNPSN